MAATDVKNDANLSASLVSYWELEEASGDRIDSHGSNDLTDNNTVTSATGKQGDAANFVASNSEYLSIADNASLSITGDISMAMWLKMDIGGTYRYVLTKTDGNSQGGYSFVIINTNKIQWSVTETSGYVTYSRRRTTATLSTGTWYHIVCTFKASDGTMTIYIDGSNITAFDQNVNNARAIYDSTHPFHVGAGSTFGAPVDGLVDEVGIWSKVLTQAEVTDLYNSGSGIPYDVGTPPIKIEKSLKYCIKTTPSAVTKSLKYVVKTTPSAITKSLTYAVTTQTAIQKSLEYQIKATPSVITKSLTYAISDLNYTREAKDTLPTDNANLATSYSSGDITDVETDDGVRVSIDGNDSQYLIHQFKTAHENATDDIRVSWNGQTIIACSVKAVYLQVYNHTSGLWETIDGDNTTAKDTDFDLVSLIDSGHANYYNGVYNEVSFRVYQVA